MEDYAYAGYARSVKAHELLYMSDVIRLNNLITILGHIYNDGIRDRFSAYHQTKNLIETALYFHSIRSKLLGSAIVAGSTVRVELADESEITFINHDKKLFRIMVNSNKLAATTEMSINFESTRYFRSVIPSKYGIIELCERNTVDNDVKLVERFAHYFRRLVEVDRGLEYTGYVEWVERKDLRSLVAKGTMTYCVPEDSAVPVVHSTHGPAVVSFKYDGMNFVEEQTEYYLCDQRHTYNDWLETISIMEMVCG